MSDSFEQRATLGFTNKTTVVPSDSGEENRNSAWTQFRLQATISFPPNTEMPVNELIEHWVLARGQLFSFPVKKGIFSRVGDPRTGATQVIGFGDTSTVAFQIKKRFERGIYNYDKDIRKPAAGGKVYLDGALQADPGDYSIDLMTGIITFTSPPGNNVEVQYCGEFFIPMRYANDNLNVLVEFATEGATVASIPTMNLIEVRYEYGTHCNPTSSLRQARHDDRAVPNYRSTRWRFSSLH